jgi:hypothetical protein
MCKNNQLRSFRTLEGSKRREAIRAHMRAADDIDFTADPHSLRISQQCALSDMAKAVGWRKSSTSPLSLGLAFYVYLSRDAAKPGRIEASRTGKPAQHRPAFVFGRGHA